MATILQVRLPFLSLLLSEPLFTQREPLLWQPSYKSEKYKDIEQLDNLYFKTPNLREINCVLPGIYLSFKREYFYPLQVCSPLTSSLLAIYLFTRGRIVKVP